jgi:hypothetical protein
MKVNGGGSYAWGYGDFFSTAADFELLFENGHKDEGRRVGKIFLDVRNIIEVDRGEKDEEPDDFDGGGTDGHTSRGSLTAISYEGLTTS